MRFFFSILLFCVCTVANSQTLNAKQFYQRLLEEKRASSLQQLIDDEIFLHPPNERCSFLDSVSFLTSKNKSLSLAYAILCQSIAFECHSNTPILKTQWQQKAIQSVRNSQTPCYEVVVLAKTGQYISTRNSRQDQEAIIFLKKADSLMKEFNCKDWAYSIPEAEFYVFMQQNKHDLALSKILKAEDLYHQYADTKSLAYFQLQNNIGLIFYRTQNYPEALKHWQKALKVAHINSMKSRSISSLYNSIGLAHKALKNYPEANSHFLKSVEIAQTIKDSIWIGIPQGNIADILTNQKKYDQAQKHLKIYLDYSLKFNEFGITAAAYTKIAMVHLELKEIDLALSNLHLAAECLTKKEKEIIQASPVSYLEYQKKLYCAYILAYEKTSQYEQAFFYQKKYQAVTDSLNQVLNREKIAEIEGLHRFKEQETENKLLKQETQNKEQEIYNQKIIIFTVSVIAFLSIVGGIYVFTYFKLKKKYVHQLEYLNHFKSKIFSVVSHDLRGYMSSLKGFVYLVRNQEMSKKDLDIITEELSKNTEYTSDVMDNLLLWAKSQLEGQSLRLENYNIKEMIVKAVFDVGWFSNNKKISIEMDVPDYLPVYTDKNVFEIALRNLLSNAIKFTKTGGKVWVKVEKLEYFCQISVVDMGVGISSENLVKIKSGISTTSKGTQMEKGIGLGLILCQDSIKENGGKFDIISELNKGTTVIFTLPLALPSNNA